jgi:hypothetical protein
MIKATIANNKYWFYSCWFLGLLTISFGCHPGPGLLEMPTPIPTPLTVRWIYPTPGTTIDSSHFQQGYQVAGVTTTFDTSTAQPHVQIPNAICVGFFGKESIPVSEELPLQQQFEELIKRTFLFVNGESVAVEPVLVAAADGLLEEIRLTNEESITTKFASGPFTMCWSVTIHEGIHSVEFMTTDSAGDELNYRWHIHIH